MKLKSIIGIILLVLTFVITTPVMYVGNAQPPPPPPLEIPIDGGLGFLIMAGVMYGAKKLIQHKKSLDY